MAVLYFLLAMKSLLNELDVWFLKSFMYVLDHRNVKGEKICDSLKNYKMFCAFQAQKMDIIQWGISQ